MMHCACCDKEINLLGAFYLPDQSGTHKLERYYCFSCYKQRWQKQFHADKVRVLRANRFANLHVVVVEKELVSVTGTGRAFTLAEFTVMDETGSINLVLWGNIAELVQKWDELIIHKARIRRHKGTHKVIVGSGAHICRIPH